ncbi:hypothetical protein Pla22_25640 [Rubripirellula amarantea]|uniref:Cephalosporin hydroxylase n=1 Tax=Rubripirellula amarantea TaxID=2527999 RepID=A0A5C5WWE0_9BACT|nr:class I SAM-dependent methyltransferase [Rubripirellula amarantea]TWT54910.1 hypothetical protein Pla22_25640 [Rubripirellula amarantea]
MNSSNAPDPTPTGFREAPHGTALWAWGGSSWNLHSDQSLPNAKPGNPPAESGMFEGQFRQTPSVLKDVQLSAGSSGTPLYGTQQMLLERAQAIPGHASDGELQWLITTAENLNPGAIWAEVGALCGRSFVAVGLSLPPKSTLITVDISLGLQRRAGQSLLTSYEDVMSERDDLRIIMIKSDSVEAAGFIPAKSCDVVYLDGAHDEVALRADISAWSTRLKPKTGLLCGHDYNNSTYPDVKKVVDQLGHAHVAKEMIWTYQP